MVVQGRFRGRTDIPGLGGAGLQDRVDEWLRYADDVRRRSVDAARRLYGRGLTAWRARLAPSDLPSAPVLAPPSPAAAAPATPPVSGAAVPDGLRVYAIGDIHGRADLLTRLFETIDADAAASPDDTAVLVFLGDYVDRGFQSKDVIDFLLAERVGRFETVFLKGNHEEAFIRFLNEPAFGPQWAAWGGAETIASYGVRPPRTRTSPEDWTEACRALNNQLPPAHRRFLETLQLQTRIGDYVFVHAGLRPGRTLEQQTEKDMLWIRDEFLASSARFDAIVVHGHTPIEQPYSDHRRICVDTGAYLSGKLTAARFVRDQVDFLSTL